MAYLSNNVFRINFRIQVQLLANILERDARIGGAYLLQTSLDDVMAQADAHKNTIRA